MHRADMVLEFSGWCAAPRHAFMERLLALDSNVNGSMVNCAGCMGLAVPVFPSSDACLWRCLCLRHIRRQRRPHRRTTVTATRAITAMIPVLSPGFGPLEDLSVHCKKPCSKCESAMTYSWMKWICQEAQQVSCAQRASLIQPPYLSQTTTLGYLSPR